MLTRSRKTAQFCNRECMFFCCFFPVFLILANTLTCSDSLSAVAELTKTSLQRKIAEKKIKQSTSKKQMLAQEIRAQQTRTTFDRDPADVQAPALLPPPCVHALVYAPLFPSFPLFQHPLHGLLSLVSAMDCMRGYEPSETIQCHMSLSFSLKTRDWVEKLGSYRSIGETVKSIKIAYMIRCEVESVAVSETDCLVVRFFILPSLWFMLT